MWALGCVVYEMLVRRVPFRGRNMSELSVNILHGRLARPLPKATSQPLADLVHALLAREPALRPTMLEVVRLPLLRPHLRPRKPLDSPKAPTPDAQLHATVWVKPPAPAAPPSHPPTYDQVEKLAPPSQDAPAASIEALRDFLERKLSVHVLLTVHQMLRTGANVPQRDLARILGANNLVHLPLIHTLLALESKQ